MNVNIHPLLHGKYSSGTYTVVSGLQGTNKLIEWIKRGEFRNFERGQFIISNKGHRSSNVKVVYAFFLPHYPAKLVMKRKIVKRIRRIRTLYNYLSGNPARRAFFASCLFFDRGISVPRPLAYWTFRHGWKKGFITGNYFLYEYQHGETIGSIIKCLRRCGRKEDIHQWHCKIFSFIKLVHLAGLRHGDMHGGNFIVSAPQQTGCFPDIKLASMCLIDMDYAKRSKRWHTLVPAVKIFFDFKDLAKNFTTEYDKVVSLLRVYFGREPTDYDLWLLRFWESGGIRIRKRLRWRIMKWRKHGGD